jgi:uncharacterized repeat protein (TIGR03847 family)
VSVTLKLEKQQVAALADHLDSALADIELPPPDDLPTDLGFEIAQALWTVGELAIGHDPDIERFVIVASELIEGETEDEEIAIAAEAGTARFGLTHVQAAAFVAHARAVVAGGRPACRWCGRPVNPEGHRCPRTNGHGVDH